MAGGIRIISTSTVCAASYKEPNFKIDLTPWDLQLLLVNPIQKGLLFYKPKTPSQENTLIHHLKTTLSRTLDFFPPLAGRLAITEHDDSTTSFYINCCNAGAEFVHAVADGVSVVDIIEPVYVPDQTVHSFFPLNGAKNYEGISNPLLAVQVTELVDGIFIACTINHSIVDGTSFWHFFNSWSEISRGFDFVSKPPVLQRRFLQDPDSPIHITLPKTKQLPDTSIRTAFQQRVFHFTRQSNSKLKATANAEIGTNKISSFQALLSHIWRSAIRNKCLDPDQEIAIKLAIGARPRLHTTLPAEYFGNAIQPGMVTMKGKDLVEQGLGYVAWQMNSMVANYTEEHMYKFLESWRENPVLPSLGDLVSNTLLISSSPRFNVYGNDFGWGRPIAVRSGPGNKSNGKITMFPGIEEGSVDIELSLSPEILKAMGNDAEFMAAVSTS